MERIKKNINKIVVGVVVIFIATFLYNYMNQPETIDVVEVVVNDDDAVIARQIIEALNQLEKINIQYDFFTQDLSESSNLISFSELFDFSEKDLREKEIGKNNPFLQSSIPFDFRSSTLQKTPEVIVEDVVAGAEILEDEIFEGGVQEQQLAI